LCLKSGNVRSPLLVPISLDCDTTDNHLGETPDSNIIFCPIQELLSFHAILPFKKMHLTQAIEGYGAHGVGKQFFHLAGKPHLLFVYTKEVYMDLEGSLLSAISLAQSAAPKAPTI